MLWFVVAVVAVVVALFVIFRFTREDREFVLLEERKQNQVNLQEDSRTEIRKEFIEPHRKDDK